MSGCLHVSIPGGCRVCLCVSLNVCVCECLPVVCGCDSKCQEMREGAFGQTNPNAIIIAVTSPDISVLMFSLIQAPRLYPQISLVLVWIHFVAGNRS